jgi:branched-chain amino acid transport system substrate-binding protein
MLAGKFLKKMYAGLALLLVLSLMLAACGDTPTNTAAPTQAATTAATTAAATTAAPATTSAVATTAAASVAATTAAATQAAATTAAASGNANAGKPLVIGLITSKTGALSYYGDMLEKGFMIGLDYFTKGSMKIEGREVKVLIEDDGGDANKAVEAARKLVQQNNAEILVGTPSSASALAITAINEKELKKIFIAEPAASAALTGANYNRYLFHTGRNTDQDAVVGASFAASLATKSKKIVSLYQDYAFGQDSNKSWKEVAQKTPGIEWIEVGVPTSATDFTAYIQKVLDANADVLLVSWAGATGPKLYQQMKDNDVFNKITVTGGVGDTATIKSLGDAMMGFQGMMVYWYQFPKTPENDYLVKMYKEKHNSVPDLFSPGGFSAASAIYTGLTKTKGDADAEKLITAMEGMTFPTPKGAMTFRKEDHQALQPLYIVKMAKDPSGTFPHPIPTLVKEVSAEESAPPIRKK